MAEIWNLSALCRCCHSDGNFKSLKLAYLVEGNVEIYSVLLRDTFGITISPPSLEASYTICEDCILQLRAAGRFKRQVLACEQKFDEYCRNEQALTASSEVKVEVELFGDNDNRHSDIDERPGRDDCDYGEYEDRKCLLNLGTKTENLDSQLEEYKVDIKDSVKTIKREAETKDNTIEITIERAPKVEDPSRNLKKIRCRKNTRITKKKSTKKPRIQKVEIDTSLEVHVKTENGNLYSCKTCGGSYDTLKHLRMHIFRTHTSVSLKCSICLKQFDSDNVLRSHMRRHKGRQFNCDHCERKYLTRKELEDHVNAHTKEMVYQCDLCDKQYLYKNSLKLHIRWHNGTNKKCICDTCGHSFNDRTNLTKHIMTVHKKLRPYACTYCPKQFAAKKNLTVHLRRHTGERPYTCDICYRGFIDFSTMKKHKLIHETSQTEDGKIVGRTYECVVCKEKFIERGKFNSHVRSHVGSLPHKCHMCAKDFSNKFSLKRHINEHYGVKAFSCDICQTRFTQKTQLTRHMANLHDPNKPPVKITKCELCKKGVKDIEKHRDSHVKRPFTCELCDKRYSEKNALNRHVKNIHLGRKPHACDLCEKKYIKPCSLKRHKLKKHRVEMKEEVEDGFDNEDAEFTIE